MAVATPVVTGPQHQVVETNSLQHIIPIRYRDVPRGAPRCLSSTGFTRRWKAGVPVPVNVVWDHANDLFVYTAGTEQHVLTYGDVPLIDSAPPVVSVRDLQVRNVLPNCSSPVGASATARYDFLQIATETNVFP